MEKKKRGFDKGKGGEGGRKKGRTKMDKQKMLKMDQRY